MRRLYEVSINILDLLKLCNLFRMKKIIFFISVALTAVIGSAQTMEVSLGYGTPSFYAMMDTFISTMPFIPKEHVGASHSNGILHLEVTSYSQSRKWRYGGEANVEFFHAFEGMTANNYYNISPKVDYFWSSAEKRFRLYSGLSAGVLLRTAKYTDQDNVKYSRNSVIPALNITPIGVRYGGQFGVNVEINMGSRAIVHGGVSYLF